MEDPVRRFLYDVYGYGRIEDFVSGKKGKAAGLRQFFAGTIIGTWRGRVLNSANPERGYIPVYWPPVSKVMTTEEIIAESWRGKGNFYEREDLQFHISSRGYFQNCNGDDVFAFMEYYVRDLFGVSLEKRNVPKRPKMWDVTFETEEFAFHAIGSGRPNTTNTIVDFSAPLKDELDNMVKRYYFLRHNLPEFDKLNTQNV